MRVGVKAEKRADYWVGPTVANSVELMVSQLDVILVERMVGHWVFLKAVE
jgi:hypothetical protein